MIFVEIEQTEQRSKSQKILSITGNKVYRKSMATSPSKAMLGDVYVDDLVSSCSSGVDFTKPAGVYFRI
ncbi:hypothetical protein Ahy_A03g014337 isoform G [Arachis hypogaea]|uniref:Uncharacterized protein n=1 Tax=Arachis hypogaea TaxID=3818 RepID=A0A445DXG2_ARAHY|nr:hypothetical protein Ahy_A03g014337 isoform G [Arachis hypogaea]